MATPSRCSHGRWNCRACLWFDGESYAHVAAGNAETEQGGFFLELEGARLLLSAENVDLVDRQVPFRVKIQHEGRELVGVLIVEKQNFRAFAKGAKT